MTTRSIQDYLIAIHDLQTNAGAPVGTQEIARRLNVKPASVTNMIERLARRSLLVHERYRGVHFTAQGKAMAQQLAQRHTIIERYLMRVLEFDAVCAHREADRLEHVVSDELLARMDAMAA
jgi:DtxR family transcriptional regulator, Mn-dependent transcriptional regulator